MSKQVGWGIYAGMQYIVAEEEGRRYISPDPQIMAAVAAKGADMKLLNDIGEQDPDDVMAAWLESVPEKQT